MPEAEATGAKRRALESKARSLSLRRVDGSQPMPGSGWRERSRRTSTGKMFVGSMSLRAWSAARGRSNEKVGRSGRLCRRRRTVRPWTVPSANEGAVGVSILEGKRPGDRAGGW